MQQYYHRASRNTNRNQQPLKIPGGSFRIPPSALLMIWAAYRQQKVNWLALRVWIAIWEIKCWHEARAESDVTPHYSASQITTAIKSPNLTAKRLQIALSALERINLVTFTPTAIWIATNLDDLRDQELRQLAGEMLDNIGHDKYAADSGFPVACSFSSWHLSAQARIRRGNVRSPHSNHADQAVRHIQGMLYGFLDSSGIRG